MTELNWSFVLVPHLVLQIYCNQGVKQQDLKLTDRQIKVDMKQELQPSFHVSEWNGLLCKKKLDWIDWIVESAG